MMIGGDKAAVDRLDPIFSAMAPGAGSIDKTPGRDGRDPRVTNGYMHAGPAGSGHFVKMVHNGIEYGLMQAYAEGFDILQGKTKTACRPMSASTSICRILPKSGGGAVWWRHGCSISPPSPCQKPDLSEFSGGWMIPVSRWTINAAIEEAVPAPVITAALYTRFRSAPDNSFGEKLLSAMRNEFGGHVEGQVPGHQAKDGGK